MFYGSCGNTPVQLVRKVQRVGNHDIYLAKHNDKSTYVLLCLSDKDTGNVAINLPTVQETIRKAKERGSSLMIMARNTSTNTERVAPADDWLPELVPARNEYDGVSGTRRPVDYAMVTTISLDGFDEEPRQDALQFNEPLERNGFGPHVPTEEADWKAILPFEDFHKIAKSDEEYMDYCSARYRKMMKHLEDASVTMYGWNAVMDDTGIRSDNPTLEMIKRKYKDTDVAIVYYKGDIFGFRGSEK